MHNHNPQALCKEVSCEHTAQHKSTYPMQNKIPLAVGLCAVPKHAHCMHCILGIILFRARPISGELMR